jgi:hypothetical protein
MCLNETYSKVCIGKHLSDAFHFQYGLEGDALLYTHTHTHTPWILKFVMATVICEISHKDT